MGMAANPSGAHQAGRVFAGRIFEAGVSVRGRCTLTPMDVSRLKIEACPSVNQSRRKILLIRHSFWLLVRSKGCFLGDPAVGLNPAAASYHKPLEHAHDCA